MAPYQPNHRNAKIKYTAVPTVVLTSKTRMTFGWLFIVQIHKPEYPDGFLEFTSASKEMNARVASASPCAQALCISAAGSKILHSGAFHNISFTYTVSCSFSLHESSASLLIYYALQACSRTLHAYVIQHLRNLIPHIMLGGFEAEGGELYAIFSTETLDLGRYLIAQIKS